MHTEQDGICSSCSCLIHFMNLYASMQAGPRSGVGRRVRSFKIPYGCAQLQITMHTLGKANTEPRASCKITSFSCLQSWRLSSYLCLKWWPHLRGWKRALRVCCWYVCPLSWGRHRYVCAHNSVRMWECGIQSHGWGLLR